MSKKEKMRRLTDLQELFAQKAAVNQALPKGQRQTIKAIHMSVYSCTEKSAESAAARNMKKPNIKARIAELQKPAMKKVKADIDRVFLELSRGGLYDPALAYDENNCLLPIRDMPIEIRAAIAGIEVTELFKGKTNKLIGYTKKVKFHNKPKNLELLGKTNILNMYTENVNIEGPPACEKSIEKAKDDIIKDITRELKKMK